MPSSARTSGHVACATGVRSDPYGILRGFHSRSGTGCSLGRNKRMAPQRRSKFS